MSLAALICGRVIRIFQSVLGLLKRALCFMRKRENIGELPFTVVVRQNAPEDPYPSAVAAAGWDERWEEKQAVEEKIDEWRRKKAVILIQAEANPTGKNEDIDFFNDMQPEIKKAKKVRRLAVMRVPFLDFEPVGILLVSLKVVLKSKTQQAPRGNRNLFGFTEDSSVDVVS
ncbi:unnamed protein product [Heligmosomoides polygyrus]|uniref:Phosducin domain-containing protein n=1 Tax=Heligmosomoides polygyrus TaxID=6339 RepID=A0A183FWW8_HELPZ|nr:unnamed protein product [Heligmosomoides polygyrus]